MTGPTRPTKTLSIPDASNLRVGGRVNKMRSAWREVAMPFWLRRTIRRGLKFRFSSTPTQEKPPHQPRLNSADRAICDEEIVRMLAHGVCRDVTDSPPVPGEFLLTLFVARNGERERMVFNFPPLNDFCETPHFKMETWKDARASILPNDFCIRGDFTRAYWGLRIHPSHRRYCRFLWRGRKYELLSLTFGASIAPYIFDSVMAAAVAHLRKVHSVRMCFYLDDWMVLNQCPETCLRHAQLAVDLFSRLGFIVHPEKTDRIPHQAFSFLGIHFDSTKNLMRIPKDKERDIRRCASKLLTSQSCTPRRLASLIGKIVFAAQVSTEARLHYSHLEWTKIAWLREDASWDKVHALSPETAQEIAWWSRLDRRLSPMWIHPPPPDILAAGDAGPRGWGSSSRQPPQPSGYDAGLWTEEEKLASTNVRELMTLLRTLPTWASQWKGKHVQWTTDSAVAFRYLNKVHGRFKHLTQLAQRIHRRLHRLRIKMSFRLVPGAEIAEEDNLSRLSDRHDYHLSDIAYNAIVSHLGRPTFDLFASRFTTRAERFFSRRPDPLAEGVDAFAQAWRPSRVGLALAFPPPLLARRVIQKAAWEKAQVILVLPAHTSAAWWPLLRDCKVTDIRTLRLPPGSVVGADKVMSSWGFTALRLHFA